MKRIHKHTIPIINHFTVALPTTARILKVGVQDNVPCFWYMFDVDAAITYTQRDFIIVTTGNNLHEAATYIDTFQIDDHGKPFVGHLFVKW